MQEITGMPPNSFWGGKHHPKVALAMEAMAPAMSVNERKWGTWKLRLARGGPRHGLPYGWRHGGRHECKFDLNSCFFGLFSFISSEELWIIEIPEDRKSVV